MCMSKLKNIHRHGHVFILLFGTKTIWVKPMALNQLVKQVAKAVVTGCNQGCKYSSICVQC